MFISSTCSSNLSIPNKTVGIMPGITFIKLSGISMIFLHPPEQSIPNQPFSLVGVPLSYLYQYLKIQHLACATNHNNPCSSNFPFSFSWLAQNFFSCRAKVFENRLSTQWGLATFLKTLLCIFFP